jgi:hypothetical protein
MDVINLRLLYGDNGMSGKIMGVIGDNEVNIMCRVNIGGI